jgi:hypothetical protein
MPRGSSAPFSIHQNKLWHKPSLLNCRPRSSKTSTVTFKTLASSIGTHLAISLSVFTHNAQPDNPLSQTQQALCANSFFFLKDSHMNPDNRFLKSRITRNKQRITFSNITINTLGSNTETLNIRKIKLKNSVFILTSFKRTSLFI